MKHELERYFGVELGYAPHPCEIVQEYLDFFHWSRTELVSRSGLTTSIVNDICDGKCSVTPSIALGLEQAFNRVASFWLALQEEFDTFQAQKQKE